GHFGDLSARYTAYGLFGTGAYAGIGIQSRYDASNRLVSPLLLFGVPITQRQTLRGTYQRSGTRSENNSATVVNWLYESSDDPYFARHGFDVAAGPQWQ